MADSASGRIESVNTAERPASGRSVSPRNYEICIDVQDQNALITSSVGNAGNVFPLYANLPERFHMELQSNWSTPMENFTAGSLAGSAANAAGVGGAAVEGIVNTGLGAAGLGTRMKAQFLQVWESTGALELNFDLVFYAQQNTKREVKDRHLALLKLCAPSGGITGQELIAPGPHMISGVLGGRTVDVYIGNYLQLKNVIIRSVGSDIVTLFDAAGIPVAMTINIAVATLHACVTTEDLDEIFGSV